jgi:hypothetical protein
MKRWLKLALVPLLVALCVIAQPVVTSIVTRVSAQQETATGRGQSVAATL